MKKIINFLFIFMFLTACAASNSYTTITANDVQGLVNDGAIIIDVRSEEEYNEGHIVDAINIPVDNISSVAYNLETPIIVYCASGVRSAKAASALVDMGYTKIYNIDGGLLNASELLEES